MSKHLPSIKEIPLPKYRMFKGVDFDGTLVKENTTKWNEPVMPMVEMVQKWLADGEEVIIFTARGWQSDVALFCQKYFGQILPITNVKECGMAEWYDDRCIVVERDTGRILDPFKLEKENAELKKELTIRKKEVRYLLSVCKRAGINVKTKEKEQV
jgi:hypothetical protein